MRYLQAPSQDDFPIYKAAAESRDFPDIGHLEAPIRERFKQFDQAIGAFSNFSRASSPLDAYQKELELLYGSEALLVKQYKERLRQRFGTGCPYCGELCTPTQLDHYLPKSKYSEFSLFSRNLVPTCVSCNQHLSNSVATTLDLIFPFADKFLQRSILSARFDWSKAPFAIELTVDDGIVGVDLQRVRSHLDKIKIDSRFVISASGELTRYGRLYNGLALEEIAVNLASEVRSYLPTPGPNAWPAVVAQAAINDPRMLAWIHDFVEPESP